MTQEDKLYLSSFEKNFTTALKFDYSSAIPVKDINKMIDIIHETEPNYSANINCSRCVLALLKKIGQMYFDSIAEEVVEETETKPKKSKKSPKEPNS